MCRRDGSGGALLMGKKEMVVDAPERNVVDI
jgi:hypothetical protein